MRHIFNATFAVFLCFSLLSGVASARYYPYRWDLEKPIIVENRLGPKYKPLVNRAVRQWKQAYPKLRFTVRHLPKGPCRLKRRVISICEVSKIPGTTDGRVGETETHYRGREITKVQIRILDGWVNPYVLCHELGHALGLTHNYKPNGSCMAHGGRESPGPYDRKSLRLLYQKEGPRWP